MLKDYKEYLKDFYKRSVPEKVRLNDTFDKEPGCVASSGDIVFVKPPPDNIELDDSSIWVELKYDDNSNRLTRIYDHEYDELK